MATAAESCGFQFQLQLKPFNCDPDGFPSNWTKWFLNSERDTSENFRLIEVKDPMELTLIRKEFENVGVKVRDIQRIENRMMWEMYKSETDHLKKNRHKDFKLNEKYLFHGTSVSKNDICEEGLDMRLSRQGFFGKGIYFSDDPRKCIKYSSGNSDESDDSFPYILKCRVILGDVKEYETGEKNTDLKREPKKENPSINEHKYYDSVKGKPKDFNEYVIYENRRALIEYIITYHPPDKPAEYTATSLKSSGFVFHPPQRSSLNEDVSPSLGAMSYTSTSISDVSPSLGAMSYATRTLSSGSVLPNVDEASQENQMEANERNGISTENVESGQEIHPEVQAMTGYENVKVAAASTEDVHPELQAMAARGAEGGRVYSELQYHENSDAIARSNGTREEDIHPELLAMRQNHDYPLPRNQEDEDEDEDEQEDEVHPELEEMRQSGMVPQAFGQVVNTRDSRLADEPEEDTKVRPVLNVSRDRPSGKSVHPPPKDDLDDEVQHQLLIQQVRKDVRARRKAARVEAAITEAGKKAGLDIDPHMDILGKLLTWEEGFKSGSLPQSLHESFIETYGEKLTDLKARAMNGVPLDDSDIPVIGEEEAVNQVLNRVVMEFLEITETEDVEAAKNFVTQGNYDLSQALDLFYQSFM